MNKWLIIGGTSRSGTTSTYYYLRDHPIICASTIKETGYFLGSDNPLPRPHQYNPLLAGYASLFPCESTEQVWMEATPHYLYSAGTAERIYKANPEAKVVFLLREPVSRLISWHKFGALKGMLLTRMTFAQFIAAQHQQPTLETPFPLRAMAEGRYAQYLARWFDVLPRESIMVTKYSNLDQEPRATLQRIATFAGIDTSFYEGYEFEVHHASYEAKSLLLGKIYNALQWRLRWAVRNSPMRVHLRDFEKQIVRPVFKRLNSRPNTGTDIPDEVRVQLEDYYRDEPSELAEVLGLETWDW